MGHTDPFIKFANNADNASKETSAQDLPITPCVPGLARETSSKKDPPVGKEHRSSTFHGEAEDLMGEWNKDINIEHDSDIAALGGPLSSAERPVARKVVKFVPEDVRNPHSRPQTHPQTAVALLDLLAQVARVLAHGLHVADAQEADLPKPISIEPARGILKRTSPPPALTFGPERASPDNNLANPEPEPSPTFNKFVQTIEYYRRTGPTCPQALIKYVQSEVLLIDEADWLTFVE